MAYKILTKNGIDNTNIDGARAEYFNSGMRDGIVKGALNEGSFISNASNSISLDSCELRIAGHRIVLDEAVYKTFSNKPTVNTRYSFIAQIVIDDNRNVDFSMFVQSSDTPIVKDDLYKSINGIGTYQVEIGRFTQMTDGTIADVIRTIDVITGNGNLENEYIRIGNVNTTMLDVGLNAEVDIENVVNEDTGLKQTNFNFAIPQGSIIKVNGANQSEVEFSSDPQSQINQKADKNGEYKELGAGYLANTLYISAGSTLGWRKLGSINNSNIASVDNPSIILLINGLYASQDTAGAAETGIIEFEARRNGGTYLTTGVTIICGNLKTEDFCSTIENGVVNLYMNLPSQYNSFKITVLNQSVAGSSNVNIFDYSGAYYGKTAPSGAVYAVIRNNASELNGKPSSSYVDISSDQTISGQKTYTNDITLKSDDGADKSLTITDTENNTIFKVRGAVSAKSTVLNSAAYYIRNRLNGNTGIIINPDTGIRVEKDNLLDIGYDKFRFKDLYLSGSITDGTNTTEVADLNKPNVRVASTTYTEPIYLLGVLNTNPALKDTWQDSRFYFIPDTQTLVTPNIGDGTKSISIEEIATKGDITAVYRYKGSVSTVDDLPLNGNTVGDVYNTNDTDANYAWDGNRWDVLGGSINLTDYLTISTAQNTYATKTSVSELNTIIQDQINNLVTGVSSVAGLTGSILENNLKVALSLDHVQNLKITYGTVNYTADGNETFDTGLTTCYAIAPIIENTTSNSFIAMVLLNSISGGIVTYSCRGSSGRYQTAKFRYIAIGI